MAAPRTLHSGMFKPGQSGNPRGRLPVVGEVRDLARVYTATAIQRLAEIVLFGRDDRVAIAAAEALLDRGWGRPVQGVTFEDRTPPQPSAQPITPGMSATEAAEAYRQMLTRVDAEVASAYRH